MDIWLDRLRQAQHGISLAAVLVVVGQRRRRRRSRATEFGSDDGDDMDGRDCLTVWLAGWLVECVLFYIPTTEHPSMPIWNNRQRSTVAGHTNVQWS